MESETRATHTPGPWHNGFGPGCGKSQIIDAKDRPLATVAIVEPENGELYEGSGLSEAALDLVEANARLIASAPELFAACEWAMLHTACNAGDEMLNSEEWQEFCKMARTAIAKATGD